MNISVKTDIGKQREMNQDYVKMHKFDDETALLIVSHKFRPYHNP